MLLLPIQTRRIIPGDSVANIIVDHGKRYGIVDGDIIVLSSKAVATAEGRIVDLSSVVPSEEALVLAAQCGRSAAFCEAVLAEMRVRNGTVRGTCSGAILTELRPHGLPSGSLFTANAGLDESNTEKGTAVGWPEDPVQSARALQENLGCPVIITDSCVRPRRWGVTAFALTVAGIDPLRDEAGREDLFGRKLRITKEAIADQLATAANMLMGNADQGIPAVIARDHGIMMSNFVGWVPGIEPEEDLFNGII